MTRSFILLKVLVILFIIKLIVQIKIFKYLWWKHRQSTVQIVRTLEHVQWHYAKVNEDIRFIKICKKEDLLPKFAKIQFSIRYVCMKLKQTITHFIWKVNYKAELLLWKMIFWKIFLEEFLEKISGKNCFNFTSEGLFILEKIKVKNFRY